MHSARLFLLQNCMQHRQDCTCLGYLGQGNPSRNVPFSVLPKVAKASTALLLSRSILQKKIVKKNIAF
jgi:hypothetical protein